MDLTSINRATLHPTQLPSSAITADASATIRATVPTQDPTKTIAHPTRNVQPTMKTLLLAINNALTLLLTLVKTPKIIQDTITKLSKLPPLINLMINKTTSHGPIPLYLRCLSINLYLIEIIFQLPTMLLPTLEPQLISLMTPQSPYQRFGPPLLANWLPDSGATSHYTPLFSDLSDVEPCSVPISLADGSTKMSTHKGTTECHFTTDDGLKSILGLTDVYFVEGLSHRLLSLTALSCTQNFSVLIKNRATTIQLPNGSTYTWPIITREVPNPHQAFSTTSNPKVPFDLDSEPEEQHFDDTTTPIDTDQRRSVTALPLELIYRRLAYRNFRNLMVGSLHQTWNDHVLTPTVDHNSWPLRISISQKRARNKTPQRQGTEPFHRLHLDLMRNPFRYGLTTNSNYSAYLFIVTTPGKLTGWIGLPTESTTSILIALKQWLTDTELLGRTQSVRFIRTDAGSAFTSTKFISECTSLGIKVEAAAPEHQEMNGICEAKWREVHNTANILLNNARLGGAFFHHAHAYAVQILNVCPAKNVIDQDGNPTTPYQYSFQRKPSIANFRVFGCPTFFKRYEPTFRNKLITYKQQLQRASRGIFLGFP
ncbi:Mitochondrial protein [Fragilaria crotonensis]|nr:Mitochondrial protein [Fragilaria crotonensis]